MLTVAPPVPPTLTLARLTELARRSGSPCVSVLMPIDRRHPDDRLDHGVLDRLVDQACAGLRTWGADGEELLTPMRVALDRRVIAEHAGAVAFYACPGFSAEMEVGVRLDPLCVVGDRFEVSPLLPSVDNSIGGHVLALGAEHVRLWHVGGAALHECEVPGLPRSVDEALWFERTERHSGSHGSGLTGRRATIRRGHGSGVQPEDRKARLERFFHVLDHVVLDHVGVDRAHPLVVVGPGPLVTRYRSITRHPWPVPLEHGSTARLGDDEVRRLVATAVASTETLDAVVDRLATRLGTGLAGTDPDEVIAAAEQGAVGSLLVAGTRPWWAHWPESTVRLDAAVPGAVDLVNLAVTASLRSHATVHLVPPDALPGGAAFAAVYRY